MRHRKEFALAAACLLGLAVTLHCRAGTEQRREQPSGSSSGQPAAGGPSPGAQAYSLTAEERARAVELAGRALRERNLAAEGPIFVVDADLIRDKVAGSEEGRRGALVTEYRYNGDLAIITHVDLAEGKVLQVETVPHLPVPLAEEEFKRARQLALDDAVVRGALGSKFDRVTVEALVTRPGSQRDPLYGHRLVRLLFKVDRDYLSQPAVLVDLTAGKVLVQPEKPPTREEHQ
jgi:hypothetical protein